jgi:uncharacterized membrane protein
MIGIIYALISAVSSGIKAVIHKHVMKTESAYTYSLIMQWGTLLLFLPLALISWRLPKDPVAYIFLILSGIIWTISSILSFSSYKHTNLTIREVISQSRLVLVFVLSIIFLAEKFVYDKLLGTGIMLFGMILLTYHKDKKIRHVLIKVLE